MEKQMGPVNYVRANRSKLFKSFLCFASYAGMGSVFTLLGSCLLDYQILIDENFTKTAYLVQERALGYVFGSLVAGMVVNYFSANLMLSGTNLVLGLSIISSPFLSSFVPLSVATVVGGVALGFLEIYCNVYIAHLWEAGSTNYLQALHMSFDLGALVTPLVTSPFLLPMDTEDYNLKQQQASQTNSTNQFTKEDVLIQYPHLALGLFLVAISFIFAGVWRKETGNDRVNQQEEEPIKPPLESSRWRQSTAIVLTALIINFEFGGQNLVSALGPSFAVKSNLRMSKQEAAVLVSVYWTVCSIYRLFLIPAAIYFSEAKLIIFNVVIIIAGASTMVAGADSNRTLAWVSFSLLSMGFAPCFAFSFGMIQRYFSISNRVASLVFLAGTLGESIHPWIVANYLESSSSFYTTYFASIAFINSILCIVLVTLTVKFFNKHPREYEPL